MRHANPCRSREDLSRQFHDARLVCPTTRHHASLGHHVARHAENARVKNLLLHFIVQLTPCATCVFGEPVSFRSRIPQSCSHDIEILQIELAPPEGFVDVVSELPENGLPLIVFDSSVPGNIQKVASGEKVGTAVGE